MYSVVFVISESSSTYSIDPLSN